MKFLCFPSDLEGVGCYRLLYPYMMLAEKGGHTCEINHAGEVRDERGVTSLTVPKAVLGGPHDQEADGFLDADVYVLQRPLELLYAPLAAWLKSHGKTVVCDVDDWFDGIPEGNVGSKRLRGSARHSATTVRRVIAHADMLTVTTPRLAELYGRDTPTTVIPNFLLRRDWAGITPAYEQDRGKVRVGWQGWKGFRGNDLRVLKRTLTKLLAKHPEVVFVNVGKPDTLHYLRVPEGRYLHVEGAWFPNHAPRVASIDIGCVPLTHNEFNECKSSLKAQEYGAVGAPFVASPSGPNKQWCDGTNGLIAASPAEWLEALDHLLTNDNWRTMGRANHAKSQANMIDENWVRWAALYDPAAMMAA